MLIKANKTAFELMASKYDEIIRGSPYYHNQRKTEVEAIDKFIPTLERNKQGVVLDVGCGTGDQALLLLEKGYFVIGIDPSREMLRLAKEKTKKYKNKIKFHFGDLESFRAGRTRFQAIIVCGSVLNLQKEWRKFFRKVSKLLSPNGILVISFDNMLGMDSFCLLINNFLKREGIKDSLKDFLNILWCLLKNKQFSESWEYRLENKKLPVKLYYLPLGRIKKVLRTEKIKIREIWGTNFLTCLLPSVLYSSAYLNVNRYQNSWLLEILDGIDKRLRRIVYPLASNIIIIARKEGGSL